MSMNYDKSTATRIKQWLMNHGLTENGTYGLMANLYCESGFRSNNLQNSYERSLGLSDVEYTAKVDSGEYQNFVNDHAGFGLAQWTFWSRKEALLNFARDKGASIGDEEMQLEYLLYELTKKYPTILNLLKSSNDERECAIRVMLDFERPANQSEANQQKRADYATELKRDLTESVKGEEKMGIKIVLDAGHGYNTLGKRCDKSIDPNQTREWVLNDRIMDKLQTKLKNYECEVLRTDDTTGAQDVSLASRVSKANKWNPKVFISMHHNAGINRGTGGGTVVYHSCSSARGIAMANSLYSHIVAQTGLVGNRSTKVKKSNLYVTKNVDTYAYLVENGFMDSKTDVPIIITDAHAEKTANGILNWLVQEFGLIRKGNIVDEPKKEQVKEPEVKVQYFPACSYTGVSIVSGLKSIGVDSSKAYRAKIAKVNGIENYSYTAAQNKTMLTLLKRGKLIKP